MDKKLLSALNNLSLALEKISDIISQKSDKKSDTAKALSSGDLSKQFEELNKSLKQSIAETQAENKKILKESGLGNLNKEVGKIESSLKTLIASNRQLLTMQKSLSQIKPEVIVSKSKIIIPKLKPIEVPLRYGKLNPLILPIPKPIVVKLSFSKLSPPTLPKLGPITIGFKYTKLPELPKLPKPQSLQIPIVYGKLPSLPKLASIEPQEIPLIYGQLPSLPKLASIEPQEIPLTYGQLPSLPKLASIEPQEIGLFYGQIPSLPELNKFDQQEIPLVYGSPSLPKLASIDPQEIGLFYGQLPSLPKLASFDPQEIPLVYGSPSLPKLASIKPQEISLFYGKVPNLPKLGNIKPQEIPVIYGKLPSLPKLGNVKPQEIPLTYGKLPNLPKLGNVKPQEIPLQYGKVPSLPKLAKISAQEIPLRYGKKPNIPKLGKPTVQEIPLKYGKAPKFTPPKISKVMIPTEYEKPKNKVTRTKDRGGLFGDSGVDSKQSQNLKSGLQLIVLMAAGILALGLAFKIVGKVNFASVVGLSLAIGILAVSFSKLSQVKSLTPKNTLFLVGVLVGISLAVTLSSMILRSVRPVGILQLLTAVMIAGMFVVISYGLGKLMSGIGRISTRSLIFLPLLPLIMVGISMAIAASSQVLKSVRPIGLYQAFTAILIAGMFSVISYGLGNLLGSLGKLNLRSIAMIPLLPLILVAVAKGIEGSSHILAKVKPIGFFQALTAIFIGVVFAAIGFGLGKIIEGLSKVKDKTQAVVIAAIMPLVLVAMSAAIMLSSHILAKVKPVGFLQALTAIFISVVFVVISYAIPKVAQAVKNLRPEKMIFVPAIMVAMSLAITLSSYIFAQIKPVSFSKLMTAVGIAIVITVIGYGLGIVLDKIGRFTQKRITTGAKNLLIIAATLVATSLILAVGQYSKYPGVSWTFFTAMGLVIFGGAIYGLEKLKLTFTKIKNGAKSILLIAGVLVATSFILSVGKYTKYPPAQWVFFTAMSLVAFGAGILALDKLKLTLSKVKNGSKSLLIIASLITASSLILSVGKYTKYPSFTWAFYTAVSLVVFGGAILLLDRLNINVSKVATGSLSVLLIAGTITATSLILAAGKYTKYPSIEWTLGVAAAMIPFGIAAVLLGSITSSGAGAIAMLAGLASIIGIASTVFTTSLILNAGSYNKYPSIDWTLGVAAAMIPFGMAALALGSLALTGIGAIAIAAGLLSVIAIAGTILTVDKIISSGRFSRSVPYKWTIDTSAVFLPFALATVGLAPLLPLIVLGSVAVIAVSYLITKTADILSKGDYKNSVPLEWTINTLAILAPFAAGTVALGYLLPLLPFGALAVIGLSYLILKTADILSKGDYKNAIPLEWSKGTIAALAPFGAGVVALGMFFPYIPFGSLAVLGLSYLIVKTADILSRGNYKNPIPIDWTKGALSALTPFAIGAALLGPMILGIGLGGLAILGISKVIVETDEILSKGNYRTYPSFEWSKTVGSSLAAFAVGMGALGTVIAGTLGLGAVALAVGGGAVLMVAETIVKASNILAGGNYKEGPSLAWSNSVASAIGSFSSIYKLLNSSSIFDLFFGGGAGPREFNNSVEMICNAIKLAGESLSGVSFPKGPPKDWAASIGATIGSFGEIYKTLSDNDTFKVFGTGGPSPQEMSAAIIAITQGIKVAADNLQSAVYKNEPPRKWARSVGRAVSGFAPVLDALKESSGFFSSKITPDEIEKAVIGITKGIVGSAKILNEYKGGFGTYPSSDWAKGVSKSLKGFSSVFTSLNENRSWWQGSADPDDYIDAMESVAQGLVSAAEVLNKYKGGFDLNKIPSKEWGKNIAGSFIAFIPGIEAVNAAGGLFTSGASKVKANMKAIGESIKLVSESIAGGNYSVIIRNEWVEGIKQTMNGFANVLTIITDADPDEDDFTNIKTLVETIKTVSITISGGKYDTLIDGDWMGGIKKTVDHFLEILTSIEEADVDEDNVKSLSQICDTIVDISSKLSGGKFDFKIDGSWMSNIKTNVDSFLQTVSLVKLSGTESTDYETVNTLGDSIIKLSEILNKGDFSFLVPQNWTTNAQSTIKGYLNILSDIKQVDADLAGFKLTEDIADSLTKFADKLSKGNYTNMIPTDWITNVQFTLKNYLSIISDIVTNDVDKDAIDLSISLTEGLTKFANELVKGNYTSDLKPEWMSNISSAVNIFTNLVVTIRNAEIDSESLSLTESFMGSIVNVSRIISGGKWNLIPSDWMSNLRTNVDSYLQIIKSIGAFSEDEIKSSVTSLVKNLVDVSNMLTKGLFDFSINPSYIPNLEVNVQYYLKMVESIEIADPEFDYVDDLVNSLVKVSQIITGGNFSYSINPDYIPNLYENVVFYIKTIKAIEDADPDFDYVEDLSSSLVKVSKVLNEGTYTSLPRNYMSNLKGDILTLVSLLIEMSTIDLETAVDNISETIEISEAVKNVSLIIAKGDYSKKIPKEWIQSIGTTLLLFSQTLNSIDSSFGSSLFGKSVVSKAEELADGLISLANKLSNNRAAFDMKKAPKKEWATGLAMTLQSILPALNYISANDGFLSGGDRKFRSGVDSIADSIVSLSKKLSKGDFTKIINPNFFKNLSDSTRTFIDMIRLVKQSDTDYETVDDLADSMVELAKAYSKLGDAIGGLNNKMTNMDLEKLGLLKNLAGSVVMLSLMDPNQFSSMMNQLENKAGVLLDVVEDTRDSSIEEARKQQASQKSGASPVPIQKQNKPAAVRTQAVATPKPQASQKDKTMEELTLALSKLSVAVASINAVITGAGGYRGVSLSSYMQNKSKPTSKGGLFGSFDDDD